MAKTSSNKAVPKYKKLDYKSQAEVDKACKKLGKTADELETVRIQIFHGHLKCTVRKVFPLAHETALS